MNATKTCTITGIETSENNFYPGQTRVKAVDNLRRISGLNNKQLKRMFQQLKTY